MKRKAKSLTFVVAVVLMIAVALAACSKNTNEPAAESSTQTQTKTPASTEADKGKEVTIKGWTYQWIPPNAGTVDNNALLVWQESPKVTGVKIDWTTTTTDQLAQEIGLIVSSGDLPDFMVVVSPSLAEQYGMQGAFQPLEQLIAEHAPNLQKIFDENPRVKAQVTSADGHIYFFPRLLADPQTRGFNGFMIRGDWLEKLGLPVPETLDDLYNVFKAFKEKDPNGNGQADEVPFVGDPRVLIWQFGVGSKAYNQPNDFFVEDKQLKYGPLDARFKEAVTYLHKLYAEGLIDAEYLGMKTDVRESRVSEDKAGSSYGSHASFLSRFNNLLTAAGKEPGFTAIAPPAGPTGERHLFGRHNEVDQGTGAVIPSKSQYAAEIAGMVDYFYSVEGRRLMYFGVEGDTYTLENGVPTYTDKVAHDPVLDLQSYVHAHIGDASYFPATLDPDHYQATLSEQGKKGNNIAVEFASDKKPPILNFTTEERERVTTLLRDIDTFVDENVNAFIMGSKPLSEFESFQTQLKSIGVEELSQLFNDAYARFSAIAD